jgi:hypothetical protein
MEMIALEHHQQLSQDFCGVWRPQMQKYQPTKATEFSFSQVVHPAAKLVALAAKTQEEEIGDNTNLVVVVAGVLLDNAESLLRQGLHQVCTAEACHVSCP